MQISQIYAFEAIKYYKNDKALIVDVREPSEYNKKHIIDAVLMPLKTITAQDIPENKKIIVYCHAGIRSMTACEKLINENPKLQLYNLIGGILSWEIEDFPLATKQN